MARKVTARRSETREEENTHQPEPQKKGHRPRKISNTEAPNNTAPSRRPFNEVVAQFIHLHHEHAVYSYLIAHLAGFINTEIGKPLTIQCKSMALSPVVPTTVIMDVRETLGKRLQEIEDEIKRISKTEVF